MHRIERPRGDATRVCFMPLFWPRFMTLATYCFYRCDLQRYMGSCPFLVIVLRGISSKAHIHYVGEDECFPQTAASSACTTLAGWRCAGLLSHTVWRATSERGRGSGSAMRAAACVLRLPRPLYGPPRAQADRAHGPASGLEHPRSGGGGDRGAPGQTSDVSAF
jgi:hypothetical protein